MKETDVKVIVAQLGARRHYAVPHAYYAKGLLSAFHTDILIPKELSRVLAAINSLVGSREVSNLAGRASSVIPKDVIRSHQLFGMKYKLRVRKATTLDKRTEAWLWGGKKLCELVSKEMASNVNHVYAFTSAAKELFEKAQSIGATTILDYATAPMEYESRMIQEETENFPGWSIHNMENSRGKIYQQRQIDEHKIADTIICASSYVSRIIQRYGACKEKIKIVPLGVSERFFTQSTRRGMPGTLRVLFVGRNGLVKGIGYLARALELLGDKKVRAQAAGGLEVSDKAIQQLGKTINLLGPVPRITVEKLFKWADVMVLPSISDTFGLVVLESMAAGVPVVTTSNSCGPDVIRDGIDGFVVPIRDPESIAACLERLAGDHELLREMSRRAVEGARAYTIQRYSERLIGATVS